MENKKQSLQNGFGFEGPTEDTGIMK